MTVSFGGPETHTWTDGTQLTVRNDEHIPPGPDVGPPPAPPPPPDQVRDFLSFASDRYWYMPALATDRIHASLFFQDLLLGLTPAALDSDAFPSQVNPGTPPWTSAQFNMFATNEDQTLGIWSLGGNVTSFSSRPIPEPASFSWVVLLLVAGLLARARVTARGATGS